MTDLNDARDAWFLSSWLIWPDDKRFGADPERLHKLANALEVRGVAGRAKHWPSALRRVADASIGTNTILTERLIET